MNKFLVFPNVSVWEGSDLVLGLEAKIRFTVQLGLVGGWSFTSLKGLGQGYAPYFGSSSTLNY